MENKFDDFVTLIKKELPDTHIIEFRTRSLETFNGIILTITELGILKTLWNIFELWTNKHTNTSIKISYKSSEGKAIKVTYTKLNKKEAEEILFQNTPSLNSPTKFILLNPTITL